MKKLLIITITFLLFSCNTKVSKPVEVKNDTIKVDTLKVVKDSTKKVK